MHPIPCLKCADCFTYGLTIVCATMSTHGEQHVGLAKRNQRTAHRAVSFAVKLHLHDIWKALCAAAGGGTGHVCKTCARGHCVERLLPVPGVQYM